MASELITVASMPMWSPVTRSMPGLGEPGTAEDVAAADHEADWTPSARHVGDFARDAAYDSGVDAVSAAAEQRLAAELQQNSPVHGRTLRHEHLAVQPRPPRMRPPT